MKQLGQEMNTGALRLVEVPAPVVRAGGVLVRVAHSVISVGTERTKLEFGRKSLAGKALERPDQVRKVLDTVAREGIASAYRKVRSRLSGLSPLGYSCAGVIEAVGDGVTDLRAGQRVACAGAGYANHAERVWVPRNLVVPVPDDVPLDAAAFATLGAIALQGVRQAEVRLGESVAVIGLGILGQLTVQLLRAAGARPIGIDVDEARVALAAQLGALALRRRDDVAGAVRVATGGLGADAVIITAATSSADPVRLAGELARDRGRVVVVGAVPVHAPRDLYYEKELELRLSRSYGPGRYDPEYEEKGHDYPAGYVRWTERRNLEEFIRLLHTGAVSIPPLITHRFPFADAERAYALLTEKAGTAPLGVLLDYPDPSPEPPRIYLNPARERDRERTRDRARARERERERERARARARISLIGAGSFATSTLVPALRSLGAELMGVVTASGLTARSAAQRLGFAYLAGSPDEVFADPETDAVVIATRHADHAALAAAALRAGKAVFVEKPLALDESSLDDVLAAAAAADRPLLVGFNRRFAPATIFVRERLARCPGARVIQIRVNAGAAPPDAWVHDPAVGGGRLVGEGCHFVDLATHLAGAAPVAVSALGIAGADPDAPLGDNVAVTLRFADGSLASIVYTSKGNPRSGKERIEVYAGGVSAVIDDFRRAEVRGRRRERWRGGQDKGHRAELAAFLEAVRAGGPAPIPLAELAAVSRATLRAARALATGGVEAVDA